MIVAGELHRRGVKQWRYDEEGYGCRGIEHFYFLTRHVETCYFL